MGRKLSQEEAKKEEFVKVINRIEAVQSVPYYNDNGELVYLNLRIQGKGGQTPPVIKSTAIPDALRNIEKKGLIKLERV